jgi:uncharacterized protein (TIGR03067 family)
MLTTIPGHSDVTLHGAIERSDLSSQMAYALQRYEVPFHLTSEDIEQAASGNVVVKVAYLLRPETPTPQMETLSSSPGVDALAEVRRRGGYVVAVLRLARRVEDIPTSASDETAPATGAAFEALRTRREKLVERWDAIFALFKGGRIPTAEVFKAAWDLSGSEMDIAASQAERHAAIRKQVERLQEVKDIVKDRFEHEVEPVWVMRQAEAELLKAQAMLDSETPTASATSPPAAGSVQGVVLDVHDRHATVSLGTDDGIATGQRLYVYPKGSRFGNNTATLHVERVLPDRAVARVLLSSRPVQRGDRVLTTHQFRAAGSGQASAPADSLIRRNIEFFENLQGTWLNVAQERHGKRTELQPTSSFIITFVGNRYELRTGAEKYASGTYRLGRTDEGLRSLDTTRTWLRSEPEDAQRPQQSPGIVNIEGETLRWCTGGRRAGERPDSFATAPDDGRLLTIWRRISKKPLTEEQLKSLDLDELATEVREGRADASDEPTDTSTGLPPARDVAVHVRFDGPKGTTVTWNYGRFVSRLPTTLNTSPGVATSLDLTTLPGHPGLTRHGKLEISELQPETRAFLEQNAIPLTLTTEDIDQAVRGNEVTKIVVLRHATDEEQVGPEIETIVSTRLDAGVDPRQEAERRGHILATLRLTNTTAEVEDGPAAPAAAPAGRRQAE